MPTRSAFGRVVFFVTYVAWSIRHGFQLAFRTPRPEASASAEPRPPIDVKRPALDDASRAQLRKCEPVQDAGGPDVFAAAVVAEAQRYTELCLDPSISKDKDRRGDLFAGMVEAAIVRRLKPAERSFLDDQVKRIIQATADGEDIAELVKLSADVAESTFRNRRVAARRLVQDHAGWMNDEIIRRLTEAAGGDGNA
ncbi:MAG: hypothetical protein AAGJ54_07420 [Planctomycetota bacterium]